MTVYDRVYPKPDGKVSFGIGIDHYPPGTPQSAMRGQGVWRSTEWWSADSGATWTLCKNRRHHEALLAGAAETVAEFLEAVRT